MTQTQQSPVRQTAQAVPGGEADKPADIPSRGWLQIAKRGWAEAKADRLPYWPPVWPFTPSWRSFPRWLPWC